MTGTVAERGYYVHFKKDSGVPDLPKEKGGRGEVWNVRSCRIFSKIICAPPSMLFLFKVKASVKSKPMANARSAYKRLLLKQDPQSYKKIMKWLADNPSTKKNHW